MELKEKFHEFQYEIKPTLELAAKNGKTSLFVERYLPLLIHLQISEHIYAILQTTYAEKLVGYEKQKLKEILGFIKKYNGQDANLEKLIRRLMVICEYYQKQETGVDRFHYG